MRNLFNKIKMSVQNPQTIIAEIHNEFDSSTEKLLQEAKRILANNDDTSSGEKLIKLGFTNSKPATQAAEQIAQKQKSTELATLIEYYQFNYPTYKFITEELVKNICSKYGLVFGDAANYIGEIPEKNILEIERFELKKEDYKKVIHGWHEFANGFGYYYTGTKTDTSKWGYSSAGRWGMNFAMTPEHEQEHFEKNGFIICAPKKDFNADRMEIKDGYKLVNIPDPIVLQPVKGGYLIVSKWGLEASDEIVKNPIEN